jgi:hypothetical protein
MPVPPDSEGYIAPVFPAFPFYATITGFPTLRSYHGSMGQNLGQIPEGTHVVVTERDGKGEFDLWVRLKNAPTNDHPDGRDGWILATGILLIGPEGPEDPDDPDEPGPEGPDGPPLTPPPADVTMLENTMGAQFIMLMRTVKAYLKA